MEEHYDLVIVGAGCVGMAMAYTARSQGKTCLILERQKIGDANRYWSSSFSGRQTRVQYTEAYLTQFVLQSNSYWDQLQAQARTLTGDAAICFRHVEGGLWFGDKNVTSSEGNIFQSNQILEQAKVPKLYMESLIPTQPGFFNNFQFSEANGSGNWAALFQPDGGSINMESSYNFLYQYATTANWSLTPAVVIADEATISNYTKNGPENHEFTYMRGTVTKTVATKKIFIACGNETSTFIQTVIGAGDVLTQEAQFDEYVASYFQIQAGKEDLFTGDRFPTWIQFLNESYTTGYGFPYHDWDNPSGDSQKKTIKIGTMAAAAYTPGQAPPTDVTVSNADPRVQAAIAYVGKYMNNLEAEPIANYRCPIVFYNNRETVCDYLNRTERDIVVQSGGWVGKYYPLLASSAFKLLFTPEVFEQADLSPLLSTEKAFLNMTSYPLRLRIEALLQNPPQMAPDYDTIVVGGGVSGLYSTYRLLSEEKTKDQKIAVFDMLDRIAGRLWTVRFTGSSTPMELGGMRYIEGEHKLLTHYVQKLHMPSKDFGMTGSPMQNYLLHAYLRNDRYRQNEWEDLQAADQKLITAYRIDQELMGMTAYQMICYSAYLIFTAPYNAPARAALDSIKGAGYFSQHVYQQKKIGTDWTDYYFSLDLEDWNIIKPYLLFVSRVFEHVRSPQPLFLYGFQNVIENQFSHEAYDFISEQNGYFSNTSNASYLDQVMTYVIDFGNVQYKTLAGGFDMFCYSLANEILSGANPINRSGGGIFLNNELINIEKDSTGRRKYCLTFKDTKTRLRSQALADKVILGMPRRSVEILYSKIELLQSPLSNYQVNTCIPNLQRAWIPQRLDELLSTTQNMPAIKIIMNFRTNWWDVGHSEKEDLKQYRTVEQMRGVSVTDLPIRQALYFGTNTDNFLLASYNDMITTEFWRVLQRNFAEFVPLTNPECKHAMAARRKAFEDSKEEDRKHRNSRNVDKNFKLLKDEREMSNLNIASVELVREVVRQLSLLHGKKIDVEDVKEAMYQNWGNDPFGGGYHNWFSGCDVEAVMKCVRRPWKDEEIFIVGQAFSNLTGWVEGALQTAEHMLIDEYDLPKSIEGYIGY